jgi:hypothetical protein
MFSRVSELQEVCLGQRHIKREGNPARLACLASLLWMGKKMFCPGPTEAAKAEQKSLVPARQAQRTNQGKTSLICTL